MAQLAIIKQQAVVNQLSRQESCSSVGADHVTQHAPFTWLIIH